MKSIPTLLVRDKRGRVVEPLNIEPECQWVADGEGTATIKFDGSACAFIGGLLYKRHRHREELGTPPIGWVHHSGSGSSGYGWLPIGDGPEDRWHREANAPGLLDGTYELVGPKVQGNPYKLIKHKLWRHGSKLANPPLELAALRDYLAGLGEEGVVWHHPDGRMAKLKCRDFGLRW